MTSSDPTALATTIPSATESLKEVLIADDDPMFRIILQSWLERWGYSVRVSADGTAAWDILRQEHPPEMLLLDWVMPGIDGIELCRRVRKHMGGPYQYILLLTGKDDKRDAVTGLEAGADDYLIKPCDQNELRAHLRVGFRILNLQRELIAAREELRIQATHDALTGMWNRRAVLDLLNREFQRSIRSNKPIGILMLDLDHFKKINDTYGHLTGDEVLQKVAKRISDSLRCSDMVGRYGGEEFLVIAPDCPKTEIGLTANRIRLAVCCEPVLVADTAIPVSISIGATVITGGDLNHEGLLAADQALYQAKNAGRNRVSVL